MPKPSQEYSEGGDRWFHGPQSRESVVSRLTDTGIRLAGRLSRKVVELTKAALPKSAPKPEIDYAAMRFRSGGDHLNDLDATGLPGESQPDIDLADTIIDEELAG